MKQILRFAVAKGYIERSPIADVVAADLLKSHTVENFARVEAEDLPGLLQQIELYRGNPHSIATLHVLLARSLLHQLYACPFCVNDVDKTVVLARPSPDFGILLQKLAI
jgi:hypothetical protein